MTFLEVFTPQKMGACKEFTDPISCAEVRGEPISGPR